MAKETTIQSGSVVDGSFAPVSIMEIGANAQPTDLIINNGRILAYNTQGQVTIQDGVVQAAGIAANAIAAENIIVSQRAFIHNIPFHAVSRNEVSWLTGSIYYTGGEEVQIQAGSTGEISQPMYIYYAEGNVLNMTPYESVAMAGNSSSIIKVIPQDNTIDMALIKDFRGLSTTISGDQITTGKVSADRIWVGLVSFVTDIEFNPLNSDSLEWTAGNIETSSGTSESVVAGSTGQLNKRDTAPTTDSNTVGLWHFDEDSGDTADNEEGTSALDGTATGTTIVTDGRFSKCRYYDGVDDYVSVSDNAVLDRVTYTMEVSFKTTQDSDDAEHVILGRENTTSSSWPYRILINGDGYLQFDIRVASSVTYILVSQIPMNDGVWHDVRATFDDTSGTMELWIDNIHHATRTGCFTNPQASSEPLMIGRSNAGGGSKYFLGYIDEIRFSTTLRTSVVASKRYIYWNNNNNLYVTTTYSDTVGTEKILLAIMISKADYGSCEVQLFGNDGTIIDGDKIQTGRISSADNKTYFDLNERRIVMNDGNTDRLVLGYAPGLF